MRNIIKFFLFNTTLILLFGCSSSDTFTQEKMQKSLREPTPTLQKEFEKVTVERMLEVMNKEESQLAQVAKDKEKKLKGKNFQKPKKPSPIQQEMEQIRKNLKKSKKEKKKEKKKK